MAEKARLKSEEETKKKQEEEPKDTIVTEKPQAEDTTKVRVKAKEVQQEKTAPEIQESKERNQGIIFRVQIAASRAPLDDHFLDAIYPGSKTIQMNRGNGWYRYSIGSCPTYYHANRLKHYIDVRGAFEVIYKDDERLDAWKLKDKYKLCQPVRVTNQLPGGERLHFKVQVAASREKLSKKMLQTIYCGEYEIYESYEEGWYKYSVGTFENYRLAADLRDKICTPGAFVVAYDKKNKISIHLAR